MSRGDALQLVTFALADDLFAADVRDVERVLRWRPPTSVPHLPPWVAGVVEHEGRSMAVVELRRRLELPPADPGVDRRILVMSGAESRIGLVVDRVLDVAAVAADRVDPAPALFRGLSREYLQGIVRRADGLAMLLDVARLLTATERVVLQQALAHA